VQRFAERPGEVALFVFAERVGDFNADVARRQHQGGHPAGAFFERHMEPGRLQIELAFLAFRVGSDPRTARALRRNNPAASSSSRPVKPPTGHAPSQTNIADVEPQSVQITISKRRSALGDRLRCGTITAWNSVASGMDCR